MRKVILVILCLCLGLTSAAWGADPRTAMRKADSAFLDADYVGSIVQLREALEGVWAKAPLTARKVTLVSERPMAYGMYTPRAGNVYDSIDPLLVYFEPVGHTAKKSGGWYNFALSADLAVLDAKGQVIGGKPNFFQWQTRSRAFNTEFMMYFTISLKGLRAGKYKAVFTLHDKNSDKKATFFQPFEIR